jgi:hypothetical protein
VREKPHGSEGKVGAFPYPYGNVKIFRERGTTSQFYLLRRVFSLLDSGLCRNDGQLDFSGKVAVTATFQ